ncbi:M1 family metallopeptidase [Flavobacterium psychrotolerans]|uniref:Aminopeptidase N n=1 Tax=Flavobacterium psychrotolerans TaxID=2169410 RepID=A0A2U1JIP9_9FLAO|nr:M1 family metallopeptidase [Flavobacterium psychrotolerans]PWA04758.1 aminopeptidase [Flavobacterium psychrotolerans]
MKYFFVMFLSSFAFAQQTQSVDFKTIHANLEINPIKRNVVGKCEYTFEVKNKIDTIRIDAQKMVFSNVKINGTGVKFTENKKQLLLYKGFKKGENTLTFNYEAFPTQAMYFVNWDFSKEIDTPEEVQGQIWTQGQGKYTSNWLPSFDDVNEKAVFSLSITFQKSFEVVSNGNLIKKTEKGDEICWQYQMTKPMSSYLAMVAIGHFKKYQEKAVSAIVLEDYYEKEDSSKVEPTYRDSKKIFDFLEKEIGVPYPWGIYRQIPVRDFLYAGMENTTSTLFTRDFVVDSVGYNDRNYLNINAHELAHQWFGNLVTAQSGKEHWLQEGFATYYALLAEREVFGEDYFYNKLYTTSQQIKEASKKDLIPILNEKASSLSFYQKGAWALHVLHEALGQEKFNLAIKNYLTKYAYQNVTTDTFLLEISLVSDYDTKSFRERWLEQTAFPEAEVNAILQKNDFIKQYIVLRDTPLDIVKDKEQIINIMKSDAYYPIKELLVYQTVSFPFESKESILWAALNTKDWNVRRAVALSLTTIPESFRLEYESLLNDKSYETQEIALFNLWKLFPEHQKRYVELSKDWVGFQDKNLKLQHLSLAFLTTRDKEEKLEAYHELLAYTGTNYDSGLQQSALEKLLSLKIYNEDMFRSLIYGMGSHRWQFVKFSKDTIRKLLKEQKHRDVFIRIRAELPLREKTQLQRLLEE